LAIVRLLDRYLLRELLVPFGYCVAAFCILWTVVDVFMELEDLQEHAVNLFDLVLYYAIKTPEVLVLIVPLALLLALLYALTNHSRYHELTAMRAAGISLWRIAAPYLTVGLILSVAVFTLNELWVPRSIEMAENILNRHEARPANPDDQWERKLGFTNGRENRRWFIEAYHVERHVMIRPSVDWRLPTGERVQLSAERAIYRDDHWVFTNVIQMTFPAARGEFPTELRTNLLAMTQFTETPEEIESAIKISKIGSFKEAKRAQLSVREILNYRRLYIPRSERSGNTTAVAGTMDVAAMLDTKLHGRLAAPWTCLVVVLIALPFGVLPGRRNVFVGVASSIVICFGYFVLSQLGLAIGCSGGVPPWLAAWFPNAFFASAGLALTKRVA
jgi:lipopolysaccharide export system permease protein